MTRGPPTRPFMARGLMPSALMNLKRIRPAASGPVSTLRTSLTQRLTLAPNVTDYPIDILHLDAGAANRWASVLKAAFFVVGYLMLGSSVVVFLATYIGWSPTLLILGASH